MIFQEGYGIAERGRCVEGLTAVVMRESAEPAIRGQIKAKLGNSEVKGIVEAAVNDALGTYFEENPPVARKIIGKAIDARAPGSRAKSERSHPAKKRSGWRILTRQTGRLFRKDPALSELFIVEGDSAGGSAKQGRDRKFRLSSRSREKSSMSKKARFDKMLSSDEIRTLILALSFGHRSKKKMATSRTRMRSTSRGRGITKIVLMTDADVDGSHIRTLLLTFFRQMPELLERGYIYIAQPHCLR